MQPVAIYARYSTDRQDPRSIGDQARRCEQYASAHDLTVVDGYKFLDEAVSGSHLERPALQRMLGVIKRRGGSPFKVVLVDDLSRLSRDLGDTWNLIFGELPAYGVRVIDCSNGMRSDQQGARLTMGVTALMNSQFLEMVKHETLRGMERRAIDGYATGGRTYGYDTFKEENPPDPEHPRSVIALNEAEAGVVRRVFALWLERKSTKQIAAILNAEGVPAPHDNGKGNKGNRGWPHTTVGYMLKNERYLGQIIWNQTQWLKVPGSKQRKHVKRPRHEWVIKPAPQLRIIDDETFQAAQAKFHKRKLGRPAGTSKKVPTLLAGMLKCGVCEGNMILSSRSSTGYANFQCTTHSSRGASICANDRTVSERKVNAVLITTLKEKFADPQAIEMFVAGFEDTIRDLEAARDDVEVASLEKQLRTVERELAELINLVATVGYSETLAEQVKQREQRKATLKADLDQRRQPFEPYRLPTRAELQEHFGRLTHIIQGDTTATREALMQAEGTFTVTPDLTLSPSAWTLIGSFDVSALILPGKTNARSLSGPGTVGKDSSGGRI